MLTTKSQNTTVGVVGFPFSKGQPRHGTEHGPDALREGGIISKLEEFALKVVDNGNVDVEYGIKEDPDSAIRNPRVVGAANKKLSETVTRLLKMNQSALVMGGDHSMAIGSIHGHAQAEPDLVVVWVDAHADINTPLTSPSGNIHGMPMSFLLKELEPYMPKTSGFEWCKPCISAKDLVYIGLRDVDPGERLIIEKFGIACYSMHEVDKHGIRAVMDMALSRVDPNGTRPIHVSFDVDGMDPVYTPATGTPVPGGLSMREACYLAEEICKTGRLSCLDLAEVNPLLSTEEKRKITVHNSIEVTTKFYGSKREGTKPKDYELPRPISAKDLVYIGLRDVDPGERLIIEKFGIACYSMHEVDKHGIRAVMDMALSRVDPNGTRPIHVSFDVDGMDPVYTPATGTPVPGGLSMREACYLAEEICKTGRLSCLDLAEVNPLLSTEEKRKITVHNSIEVTTKFYGSKREGTKPKDYELPRP